MELSRLIPLLFALCVSAEPKVYFREEFSDGDGWTKRWVPTEVSGKELGKFVLTSGKFYGDVEKDKGLQTSEDARFYGVSTKFAPFSNEDKTLVIQFTVKHEQNIDCGGGYLKVFDCSLEPKELHGETPYLLMFGPDICGPGTKKVHVIFNYKGKNILIEKDIRCKDDQLTHLYTLVVKPDNTYAVKIDNEKVESGELEKDWKFLEPRTVKDPEAKKPADWDERPKVDDPEDKKPQDWEQPEYTPDPEAQKPVDWDDDMDGEWEPPQINNPAFKGEWSPRQVDNPAFQGPWVHPEVPNPLFEEDGRLHRLAGEACGLGLDLWQVKSGTIFDNFLVTDDEEFAAKVGDETWGASKDAEKKMKEEQEEAQRKEDEEKNKVLKESTPDSEDLEDDDEDELPSMEDDEKEIDDHDEL